MAHKTFISYKYSNHKN